MAQEELFSSRLDAGRNRTYFFDVKESKKGEKYLSITESRKEKEDGFMRNNIIIWPDHIDEFIKALTDISKRIEE